MHAAGIGEGFEWSRNGELAVDGELGRLLASDLALPEASAREAPRPSMPRPSIVQLRAV